MNKEDFDLNVVVLCTYKKVTLKAGIEAEQMVAYTEELIDDNNPTGFIGKVKDILELPNQETLLLLEYPIVGAGFIASWFKTKEKFYELSEKEL